jgi:hypothetical protein
LTAVRPQTGQVLRPAATISLKPFPLCAFDI